MKCGTGVAYKTLSNNHEFNKNLLSDGRSLLTGRNEFLISRPICVLYGIKDVRIMLLDICEFGENRYSERYALSTGINEILCILSVIFVKF
jgi:hypothetical protein